MRRLLRSFAAAGVAAFALAAAGQASSVPGRISFNGRLSDAAGLVTGDHRLEFRLYDAASGGTQIWSEAFDAVSVERGLVAMSLGATTPLGPAVMDGRPLFLEVIVDSTILQPRLAILAVPYSFRSEWAASAATLGTLAPAAVVTGVTAGVGLSGGGSGGALNVSADTSYLQRRLSAGCTAGQFLTGVGADGTPACAPGSSTTYSAGPGLALAGTTFSADSTYLQRRVSAGCTAGQFLTGVGADGTPICALGGIQSVGATAPLASSGGTAPTISIGGCPSSNQILQWNGSAWACAPVGAGGVQSVGATAPVSSSGGATPTISMPAASAAADGYLRQADWSAFSAKQARVAGACAVGSAIRTIGSDGTVTCQAVTAPVLSCQEVSGAVFTLTAGLTSGENVACPAGTIVTGGGFYISSTEVVPRQGYANGNTWTVNFTNTGAATATARGYAMCCSIH